MNNDGAHLGVGAKRALEAIFGGEQPTEKERESRDAVRKRLLEAPEPLSKRKPSDYGQAADTIARAFLMLVDEDPHNLDEDMYELVERKWPGFDRWLGGASGFMVGWATNCVRWLYEQRPVPNPAIVKIG